ncbi:TonB-dependent receptor [Cyclobacterium sp. 1_MG-2023]|uniref:TonB-dependent receptor n=1 Tax=Cyclobacterium sp. 1_MG-2023 TaxID=3062681 RepID=UPI0026E42956|nr:TonB-dependent receptor [Cyclobacterium sp. 1_MG-2023]MDO6437835.1 TonB-dependent receptor [Cyclobacterium sp. 1_MG-2023]
MKKSLHVLSMVGKYYLYGFLLQLLFLNLMYASPTKGQSSLNISEVYLSLDLKGASLAESFSKIKSQTEFSFIYDQELVKNSKPVDLQVEHQSLENVLLSLAASHTLSFKQVDNRISVKIAKKHVKVKEIAVEVTVSGKVTDVNGDPIPGATVYVKGTSKGTATDIDGNYSIVAPEDGVLVFSFIGFDSQEITIGSRSVIDVILSEGVASLDEMVVVGYGTQKKVNLTGSVDVISSDMLEDRHAANVSQLLVGTTPGLNFGFDANGYQPGAKASIDIRGIGSLNGGAPYILIDGFPGDMNSLNPEDIASISVLKDAAASAIYGARAPYGVVMITTKSGKKDSKLTVNYSGSVSLVTPAKLPGTLDSYTYSRVLNEAALNKGTTLKFSEPTIDRIIAYQDGDYDYIRSQFPADFPAENITNWAAFPTVGGGWAGGNGEGHANNDFWDLATGANMGQSHNLSVQGGSEKTSYYMSAGFTNQASSFTWADDYNKRYNLTAKIKTSLTDWWDLRFETRLMKNNRSFPSGARPESIDSYNALLHIIYNTAPMQAVYDSYGNQLQGSVKSFFEAGASNDETTENWQIIGTELRPLKGWKINADFAYQSTDFYGLHDGREFGQINWLTGEQTGSWVASQVNEYHRSDYYWSSNIFSSYEWSFNESHNFMAMVGGQYETGKYRSLDAQARNLIVPDIISLNTATGDPSLGEGLSQWATEGYFGRLTYNYKEKYLLESNVRYDGTSRFLEGKRWGFFPSFSAGWVVSNEDFWVQTSDFFSSLKVRGSWGQLGNQNVSAYQDLALIQLSKNLLNWLPGYNQTGQVGYTLTPSLVSPSLTWEKAATTNIGVDMAFLGNKLGVNFDWFERNTTDMIGPSEALPGVLGASVPRSNNSSLRTRGWELSVKWKEYVNSDLSYFVGFNLYDAKAVITEYNNPTGYLGSWVVGQEVGDIWGWSSNGLFQSQQEIDNHADQSFIYNIWNTGDVKYDDLNGDGVINNGQNTIDDHGDLMLLGNSTAHYQFGINLGANYKGFDFSMLWKGTAKRDKGMNYNDYAYYGFRRANWSQPKWDHLDYYRDTPGTKYVGLYEGDANINTDAFYPRPYEDNLSNVKNQTYNSRYLGNFAYIRLQDVQLGYSLSDNVISRFGLSKVRVYLSGSNLLTFDHLPVGMDPTLPSGGYRTSTGKDYRADRIYSMGLNVTF